MRRPRCGWQYIQGLQKEWAPGLKNFVPALAYHFCLALPAIFPQPGLHSFGDSCTVLLTQLALLVANIFCNSHNFCDTRDCSTLSALLCAYLLINTPHSAHSTTFGTAAAASCPPQSRRPFCLFVITDTGLSILWRNSSIAETIQAYERGRAGAVV